MSDLSSLSPLSSDEEEPRRIRMIRERNNPIDEYDASEFKMRFRFSKETVTDILHLFVDEIRPQTFRNKAISPINQLLLALRFYATGAFQQVIGDHINVHKSTVSRIVARITHCIARHKATYITMPQNENAVGQIKEQFYLISNFPGVVGAVDCSHIKIQSPGGPHAELYRNRKGYFSINTQVICDAHLRILHIIARWPGSVHDSTIFNDSPLSVDFEQGRYGNGYLLGDSGYPCKPYLLTPFVNPTTPAQEAYNRAHIATRNPIERCFGVLKRRFPCLSVGCRIKTERCLAVIVACAVLHNIALDHNDAEPPHDIAVELQQDDDLLVEDAVEELRLVPGANQNVLVRNALLGTVFAQ